MLHKKKNFVKLTENTCYGVFFNKLADFEHILRKTFGQMFLFIVDLVESFSLTRNKVL